MSNEQHPVINKEAALERVDGDEELYQEIVEIFLEDTPIQLQKLDDAIKDGDITVAHRQAHSIKSSAANIGAEAMSAQSYTMEEAAGSGEADGLSDMFSQLTEEFNKVLALLNSN